MTRWVPLRLRLARWVLSGLPFGIYRKEPVAIARERALELVDYTRHSGHLTHRYHAGRRVRGSSGNIATLLTNAIESPPWLEFVRKEPEVVDLAAERARRTQPVLEPEPAA